MRRFLSSTGGLYRTFLFSSKLSINPDEHSAFVTTRIEGQGSQSGVGLKSYDVVSIWVNAAWKRSEDIQLSFAQDKRSGLRFRMEKRRNTLNSGSYAPDCSTWDYLNQHLISPAYEAMCVKCRSKLMYSETTNRALNPVRWAIYMFFNNWRRFYVAFRIILQRSLTNSKWHIDRLCRKPVRIFSKLIPLHDQQ